MADPSFYDPNAQDTPDESQISEAISPSKGSTSAPPVGSGPYETKITPTWSSQTGSTGTTTKGLGTLQDLGGTIPGFAAVQTIAHSLGLDKDYMAQARSLIPTPPSYPGMTTKGWAALAPGIALSLFGGGAAGASAAGKAIGAAQLGSNAATQQNWQNQMQYAQGIGSLANQEATQGRELFNAIAPDVIIRAGQQAQLTEEDLNRQQRAWEFQVTSSQKDTEIGQRAAEIAGTAQYHQQYLDMENARTQEQASVASANKAMRQQNFQLAQQRFAEASSYHQQERGIRDQLVGVAIKKFRASGGRDPGQIQALRGLESSLGAQLANAQSLATQYTPGTQEYQDNQNEQTSLARQLKAINDQLSGIAGISTPTAGGSTTTTGGNTGVPPNPGAPTGQGGGPQNPKIPPNATLAGTDKRTGHPVYRAPDGRLYDGVTGQLLN